MVNSSRPATVLFGADRRAALLGAGLGGLAELVAVAALVSLGVPFGPFPSLSVDPLAAVALLAGPATVSFVGGGLLATWWVDYPAAVIVFHQHYLAAAGFVVLPMGPLGTALVVAVVPALLWGSLGYLVGQLFRRGVGRTRGLDGYPFAGS